MKHPSPLEIGIVGGGAAGFFCAINVALFAQEQKRPVHVKIFESGHQFLKKVRISGGGRCNVTHNLFEVQKFCENYPRGQRELLSPMQKFQAKDTVAWFANHGVELVAEEDGRMFPTSNSSETIINTYLDLVKKLGIKTIDRSPIQSLRKGSENTWDLISKNQDVFTCDRVLIATGSAEKGYKLAESLGHKITERAPSLFSFKIAHPLLKGLQGLSFPNSSLQLKIPGQKSFKQMGPTLITHWGLSGPAILKLSAWAAREMKKSDYSATLVVNWFGHQEKPEVLANLQKIKADNGKTQLKNAYPTALAKRFWLQLLSVLDIDGDKQWANISKKELQSIFQNLTQCEFEIQGQNRFKDEFVECGGVSLKEIHFKTMESKKAPGVYFAGEILDVDGITGGFNFQNAWTTAWLAAHSMIAE